MARKITEVLADCKLRFNSNRNEFRGRCWNRDFHDNGGNADGNTSMVVSTASNFYHCFSCKIHGNLLKYLTSQREVGYMEAHEIVSVENIDYLFSEKGKKGAQEFELDTIIPIAAPQSFIDRGFQARLLTKQFKVGSEGDHIFIPILDNDGIFTVAIKHRVGRKFWYAPENFNKGEYLYNFHRCKGKKFCVLVEGETDVYRSCQNGVWNVTAIIGGGITDEQAELILEQDFEYVITAFDNDSAGMLNTEMAYNKLGVTGLPIKVAQYFQEDPGKCDVDEWRQAINNPFDYIEYAIAMQQELGDDYEKIRRQAIKMKRT